MSDAAPCWIWGHKHSYTHTHTMTRWVECSHYFNSMAEAPIEYIQKGPGDMLNTHTMQIALFILLWRMDRMWGRGGRWRDCIVWRREAQCRVWEKHFQLHVHIQSLWEEHLTFRTIRTQMHTHPRFRCVLWSNFMFSAHVFMINIGRYLCLCP